MKKSNIGVIGLGVMGKSMSRNIASKNFLVSVYNRTTQKTNTFLKEFGNEFLVGQEKLKDFVDSLERPRKIILMVEAGTATDMVLDELLPFLESGDIVVDCGNALYTDTIRREEDLKKKEIRFFGCGISGGEESALHGPSLMIGGNRPAWRHLKPIFEAISAKDFSQNPCVSYIDENGAGHFVKMVHNGIEYAVMQMLAEGYEILSRGYHISPYEIAAIFKEYNEGRLKSFLMEISVSVLRRKDDPTKDALIDRVLDKAKQKGTGKWTCIEGLQREITISAITQAVEARVISKFKEERVRLSKFFTKPAPDFSIPRDVITEKLEATLYAGIMIAYAQGFRLMHQVEKEQKWKLDFAEIARIWEGGCIIRAHILEILHKAFLSSESTELWEIPEITKSISKALPAMREVVAESVKNGIPLFSLGSALSSFEALTNERTSANFIQALRDAFGSHTYERTDRKGIFHTEWIMRKKKR